MAGVHWTEVMSSFTFTFTSLMAALLKSGVAWVLMYESSNTSTRSVLINLKGLILQFSDLFFYIKVTAFWDVLAYNFVIYNVFDTPATSFIFMAEEADKLKMEPAGSSETLAPVYTKVYVVVFWTNTIMRNFK